MDSLAIDVSSHRILKSKANELNAVLPAHDLLEHTLQPVYDLALPRPRDSMQQVEQRLLPADPSQKKRKKGKAPARKTIQTGLEFVSLDKLRDNEWRKKNMHFNASVLAARRLSRASLVEPGALPARAGKAGRAGRYLLHLQADGDRNPTAAERVVWVAAAARLAVARNKSTRILAQRQASGEWLPFPLTRYNAPRTRMGRRAPRSRLAAAEAQAVGALVATALLAATCRPKANWACPF